MYTYLIVTTTPRSNSIFILILNMRETAHLFRFLNCKCWSWDWNPRGLRPESVLLIIVLCGRIQLLLYPSLGVENEILCYNRNDKSLCMYLYGSFRVIYEKSKLWTGNPGIVKAHHLRVFWRISISTFKQ